jgi:hypothetical protein
VEDKGSHDSQWNTEDPLRAEKHVVNDPGNGVAPVGEDIKTRDIEEVWSEITVDKYQHGDDGKGGADASSCRLQNEKKGKAADYKFCLIGATRPHADIIELQKDEDG